MPLNNPSIIHKKFEKNGKKNEMISTGKRKLVTIGIKNKFKIIPKKLTS